MMRAISEASRDLISSTLSRLPKRPSAILAVTRRAVSTPISAVMSSSSSCSSISSSSVRRLTGAASPRPMIRPRMPVFAGSGVSSGELSPPPASSGAASTAPRSTGVTGGSGSATGAGSGVAGSEVVSPAGSAGASGASAPSSTMASSPSSILVEDLNSRSLSFLKIAMCASG